MLKVIYCNSLQELLFKISQPNPEEIYVFLPQGFTIKNNKIFEIFNKERNCIVYSDIEIYQNNNIIPQYYPSYDNQLNLPVMMPIIINTFNPLNIPNGNLSDVFNTLLKYIFGIHIPELLIEWRV